MEKNEVHNAVSDRGGRDNVRCLYNLHQNRGRSRIMKRIMNPLSF